MTRPYIGITGFTRAVQPELLMRNVPQETDRKFMVGILANTDTLNGRAVVNKGERFPSVSAIAEIFPEDPRALNLIHFNSSDKSKLGVELRRLADLGGEHLHGFQLNVCWPDPLILAEFCVDFPEMTIVLQVGGGAMKRVNRDPTELALRLAQYADLAHYVLIDPSGGRGERFDPPYTAEMTAVVVESGFLPVVAGGLSASTLDPVRLLLGRFPNLSWDAEGRLMKPEGELSPRECSCYLNVSFSLLD